LITPVRCACASGPKANTQAKSKKQAAFIQKTSESRSLLNLRFCAHF
jgi:hypothetical protein